MVSKLSVSITISVPNVLNDGPISRMTTLLSRRACGRAAVLHGALADTAASPLATAGRAEVSAPSGGSVPPLELR